MSAATRHEPAPVPWVRRLRDSLTPTIRQTPPRRMNVASRRSENLSRRERLSRKRSANFRPRPAYRFVVAGGRLTSDNWPRGPSPRGKFPLPLLCLRSHTMLLMAVYTLPLFAQLHLGDPSTYLAITAIVG